MIVGIGHLCQKTVITVICIGNAFLSGIHYTRYISKITCIAHVGINSLFYLLQYKYLVVLNIGKRHTRRGSCCNNCCQICIISQFYIKLITQLVLDDMACSKFLKAELLTVCATAFL